MTFAKQVAVLPLPSLAVSTMPLVPKLAQVNVLWLNDTGVTVPQLSEPLRNICAGVTLTVPAAFRLAVTCWQTTVGAIASTTVTVAEQVAVLPLPSLAVKVTVFAPILAQVNALGVTETRLTVPQLSEPLWNTLTILTLTAPEALRLAV